MGRPAIGRRRCLEFRQFWAKDEALTGQDVVCRGANFD
jgi:hypothetical protein